MEQRQWSGGTPGSLWMHRMLIWLLKVLNLRFVYLGMALFVVPFYMLFAHKGYIAQYHYFRRRLGYGLWQAFCGVYMNHYRFGQVIIDRFAAYAGRRFEFSLDGYDVFCQLCRQPEGLLVLSSHVGNYELAGYAFKATAKRFNMLLLADGAPMVTAYRQRLLSQNNIRMIPIADDLSHLFLLNEALADGEIVSMAADRIFGSPRSVSCPLLGADARFPLGPFVLAVQRQVPVLVTFVMKESAYRYKVCIRRVETGTGSTCREQAEQVAQRYVRELETILRQYPDQWFNYYDFWNDYGTDKSGTN